MPGWSFFSFFSDESLRVLATGILYRCIERSVDAVLFYCMLMSRPTSIVYTEVATWPDEFSGFYVCCPFRLLGRLRELRHGGGGSFFSTSVQILKHDMCKNCLQLPLEFLSIPQPLQILPRLVPHALQDRFITIPTMRCQDHLR